MLRDFLHIAKSDDCLDEPPHSVIGTAKQRNRNASDAEIQLSRSESSRNENQLQFEYLQFLFLFHMVTRILFSIV